MQRSVPNVIYYSLHKRLKLNARIVPADLERRIRHNRRKYHIVRLKDLFNGRRRFPKHFCGPLYAILGTAGFRQLDQTDRPWFQYFFKLNPFA